MRKRQGPKSDSAKLDHSCFRVKIQKKCEKDNLKKRIDGKRFFKFVSHFQLKRYENGFKNSSVSNNTK